MINKQKIKKLALIAAEEKTIPQDIQKYVLENMGKKDLKTFLSYYKKALDKKRIYITSSDALTNENISMLKSVYNDKEIVSTIDSSLGGGFKLAEDDMVVDFTFKKYINDTIEKLKN